MRERGDTVDAARGCGGDGEEVDWGEVGVGEGDV